MGAVWGETGAMHTGHKVSAVLHVGLILWVMLFDLFSAPDRELRPMVTDVALVSAEEFAALTRPRPEAPAPTPAPEPVATPQPRPQAAPIAPPPPLSQPEPRVPEPQPAPAAPPPQAAVIADQPPPPDAALRPVQRQAERVAPTPAPTPDPEAQIARRDQVAAVPDPAADPAEAPPAQEATQRAAAATETVTEATRISEIEAPRRTATAPEVSLRPQPRPQRPAEPVRTAAAPAPEPARPAPAPQPAAPPAAQAAPAGPSSDAIAEALAEALAESLAAASPDPGPASLSQVDIDLLRLRVEECWNVGILSSDALGVVVTIGFEMTEDARPIANTIHLVEAQGGSEAARLTAFDAGRRAIIDCGAQGYGLPSAQFDQWRLVEITFNPARMSTR